MRRGDAIKIYSYAGVAGLLLAIYVLLEMFTWSNGNTQLHTIMEVVATLFAAVVGVVALVRYNARRHNMILFLGVGFCGTALLDGYHAIVTSTFFHQLFPSPPESLIPWSWNASRTFLAILMFLSWLAWRREEKHGAEGRVSDLVVYVGVSLLTLISFVLFAFVPLGRAYFPDFIFGRPQEFLAAAFFMAALFGYGVKQEWREQPLDHWIVMSLLVGLVCQSLFMSRSYALFDGMFDMAHTLKIVSYMLVLVGLLNEMYFTWQAERQFAAELESRVERRTAELARANEVLERTNVELDQFAYVASHDLKSPLRAIDNLAKWIAEDAGEDLPEDCHQHIAKMQQRVQRMEKLLNDLLHYSRAGRMKYDAEVVDTGRLIEEIKEMVSMPLDFTVEVADEMPKLETARPPLEQVFMNLITNAIKHHDRADGQIEISVRDLGSFFEFTVADDGPGIDPKFHERIFRMFQTLQTRDKVEGSGMGLAVIKKVVESYSGTVAVDSSEGSGTAFRFTWPKGNGVVADRENEEALVGV